MSWRPSWQKRLTWLITVGCIAAFAACGSPMQGDAGSGGRSDASDVRMDTGMDTERSDGMPGIDVVDAVDAPDAARPCTRSEDCAGNPAGSVCDTATGRCVQCISSMDTCPPSQHCDDSTHRCVPGCRSDEGCTGPAGDGGTSASHCDTSTHTCVECLTNDHCPRGMLCMGNRCVMGCDTSDRCPTGQVCCEGGCVDTQTNADHCGACGNRCMVENGSAVCRAGRCAIGSCTWPYADCDGNGANGCETNTQTSATDCGSCGRVCSFPNASATCSGGTCALGTCNSGFGNCDGNATNGCETSLNNNISHCGGCGRVCSLPNASAICSGGTCTIGACSAGWDNCDGNAANGCETNLNTSANNCGRCGNVCTLPNATAACSGGRCAIASCNSGWADCNGNGSDGCETNISSSVTSCGACGRVCSLPNATPGCSGGTCTIASCNAGWGNCDGNVTNGCETNVTNNVSHCGMCGRVCSFPNASATCSGGTCALGTCNSGFGNCDGNATNGCETNLNTSNAHCGACGRACAAGQVCSGGTCVPSNDTRAGATVINMTVQQSLLSTNTSTATNNTTGICGCTSGRDVFFQFTIAAGQSEIVYADTVGTTWDTSLFFQDSAGNNLTSANIPNGLVCNNDGGLAGCGTGLQSQVMALLGPGTYYLVLSGCGSGAATIRFQHIPVGNGTLNFLPAGTNLTVSGTTVGVGRLSCGAGPENSYFWYSCPGYAGGSFSATTCSRASWDTKLEQVSPARGTSVCIDNDAACSPQTTITTTIPSGPGIHALHIDGLRTTDQGSYSIQYTRP